MAKPSTRKAPKSPATLGFFRTLGASLYSPDFYATVGKRTFGQAVWYLFRIALLYSILILLAVYIPVAARVGGNFLGVFGEEVVSLYPDDLVITITEGKVSTNQQEPILIPLPPSFETELENALKTQNLLVIDTQTPFTSETFETYNTLGWLTVDSILFYNSAEQEIGGYPLKNIKSLEITKEKVSLAVEKIASWIKWLLPFMGLMMVFFVGAGLWIIGVVYSLFLGALISILRSIFKQDTSYTPNYITAIYATTWVYLFQIILQGFHRATGFESFTFMVTLLTLVAVGWNLKKIGGK